MQLSLMRKDEIIDFIEFNITGDSENYNRCDDESLYLNTNVFNIFASCFERSNHLFDFISPTLYNSRNFIPLRNELLHNLETLLVIKNIAEFQNYMTGIFLGKDLLKVLMDYGPNFERHWRGYMRKIIQVNRHLMRLIDQCIDEERVLWVIPY
ncbi:MAG TPA: hypothetical protein PKO42_00235 [Tenuifilaceae bacterium]|jgi:hypothetical protein|nr:hypothetical protein [Bacteroidales bacterium]HNY08290.1 hypothetical protein [Tenuifilaceae bacterium]MBP8643866.1 hypothetical protein [Bacteroidales bacterium]NLI87236.1 hypothetical protein [Bacteroidales bacterium]HOA10004.1 hypothetical protein [Tenuifilaceae bacterium]